MLDPLLLLLFALPLFPACCLCFELRNVALLVSDPIGQGSAFVFAGRQPLPVVPLQQIGIELPLQQPIGHLFGPGQGYRQALLQVSDPALQRHDLLPQRTLLLCVLPGPLGCLGQLLGRAGFTLLPLPLLLPQHGLEGFELTHQRYGHLGRGILLLLSPRLRFLQALQQLGVLRLHPHQPLPVLVFGPSQLFAQFLHLATEQLVLAHNRTVLRLDAL
uniref:Putative secreted peptide n=1 Tax=Anopheles braziliensis TaxID=58242 RepID=A0A2M3ZQV8_9DIPT